jgi:hypothetical protein
MSISRNLPVGIGKLSTQAADRRIRLGQFSLKGAGEFCNRAFGPVTRPSFITSNNPSTRGVGVLVSVLASSVMVH